MSKPKLTYFDVRARGEISRLVMAAANRDMEEVKLPFKEWHKIKPATLYKCLPTLNVGGNEFFQSLAIATYLARENGLYGNGNLENLMVDQCVHLLEDVLRQKVLAVKGPIDGRAEATRVFQEVVYPRALHIWNHCLKINPAKSGHVVGNRLTLADIAIFEGSEDLAKNSPDVLEDNYPEIKVLRQKVAAVEGIRQYLDKRKETPY